MNAELDEETRRNFRRSLRNRRRKAVCLVEELSIRTQKIQPLMKKLEQIARRMEELETEIRYLNNIRGSKEDIQALEKELRDYMFSTMEETPNCAEESSRCIPDSWNMNKPSAISPEATCDWWSVLPRSIATVA